VSKTYYLESLGCAKNQVDSEIMIEALRDAGWVRTGDPDDADIIIVNSCGFIEPAKEESINVTLELRSSYPRKSIVMAGCLSQRYGSQLAEELTEVDGLVGNRAPERIVDVLRRVASGERVVSLPERSGEFPFRRTRLSFPGSAYVKVSEGCRNRCSFCAIPLIRGELHSRSRTHVLDEIKSLLADGVFEVNLVAQDLASYGMDHGRRELMPLLEAISRLPGEFWVRMLYIYPESFPTPVLDLCRSDPRFLPYFDIPFQHAAEPVLRRMGRPGSSAEYLRLVERIRTTLPDAVIRSSLLVGFAGETDADFAELLRFQRTAELDWAGAFVYSIEEGTPAYRYRDAVPEPRVATHRKAVVEEVQESITKERLSRFVGKRLDLLVEERVVDEDLALARAYLHAPEVDGLVVLHTSEELAPGQVVRGIVTRRNGVDLEARLVD
jgi:ribosomal protein S12 methylthiotransferase